MVTKKTRLISGVAAVLMLISMLTAVVLPASAANPWDQYETVAATGLFNASALPNITAYAAGATEYQVNSRAGMEKLKDLVLGGNALTGVAIYQTADIDMGWAPFIGIGSVDAGKPFSGTFDGNGFVIENLYVLKNSAAGGGAGLFAYMSGGTVKNVGIASGLVIGNRWTGSVVGTCTGGTAILNCWNAATIVGGVDGTAGIAGRAGDAGNKIVNCYNLGMMMTATSKVAGIAGWVNHADTYVANSYNAGEFVSAFKSVSKTEELHEYSVIVNANFKSARGTANANNYYVTGRGKTGSVAELIASGTVLSGYGFEVSAIQTNDQATGVDPSALTDSGETGLAAKLNSGDLSAGAVEGYTIGFEASNIGYPVLTYKKGDVTVVKRVAHTTTNVNGEHETWSSKSELFKILVENVNGGFSEKIVHPTDDLVIKSANDLFVLALATNSTNYTSVYGNGNISLENDINMNDMNLLPVTEYTPIGAGNNGVWTGTLDGKNHVIKNWRLYSAVNGGNACSGLITSTNGGDATIKNLGMVDFHYRYQYILGSNSYTYPAAIIDRVYGPTFNANNCFATGTFEFLDTASKNSNNLGAVYGRSWGTTINVTNCWSNIKTIGDSASAGARVIGSNSGGTIDGTLNNYYFANTTYDDGNNPIAKEPYQIGIKDAEIINNNSAIAAYLNEKTTQLWTVCADGYVTFANNDATRKIVVLETIGGHVINSTNYYANAGATATYTVPTGYTLLDDPYLPAGVETGSFTMPDENVEISFDMTVADWSIIERLIAEYESLDLDSLVDGALMRDQLGYMKQDLAEKDTFTNDVALDYIGGYVADDASFNKSLKEGYYPRYSMKDSYGTQKFTAFAISSKEDWLAAVADTAAGNFEGITLHFTNDVDMENTNMEILGGTNGFSGTIDGHGYVLKNVLQRRTTTGFNDGSGLVGHLNSTGVIQNLGIASGLFDITYATSNDGFAIGTFAGYSINGSVFRNCWNAATVKGTLGPNGNSNYCASGLVGRGYDGTTIDGCFNIGTITTDGVRSSDLNNWAQCGPGQPGCYVYNSFGAGVLSGSDQNIVKYNDTGIKQACGENRFPLYNTYSTGTLIVPTVVAAQIPADHWNPNTTNILGADALKTGEILYKINTNYQEGKGLNPYFTFNANGDIAYGNIETQIRKLTYQVGGEDVAVRYVAGNTDYTMDYALGATYTVSSGDATIDGTTLHTSKTGDMVVAVELGDKDYRALETAIAQYEGKDFNYIVNGAEMQALVEAAAAKIANGGYADQDAIDADTVALNEGFVYVPGADLPSVTEAANYSYLPGFTVSSVAEWNYVSSNASSFTDPAKTIYITADIDFGGATAGKWNNVRASLDGLGYTVKNASIDQNLFGNYAGSAIKNIIFENWTATDCEWNSSLLMGQYGGSDLLFENITMINCSATKKSANGLSLMVGQVPGGKKVTYRNITIEGSTLVAGTAGNIGFLGGTHAGTVVAENIYLNNNKINGESGGWGYGIAFGELTGPSTVKNIGVFNTTKNNTTHSLQGAVVGLFKNGSLSIENVLAGNNATCASIVNQNDSIDTVTINNAFTDAANIQTGNGKNIPSSTTTDEVMNGVCAYALNAAGVAKKWEIVAGSSAPSFDTDNTGLPVKVSFVTSEATTELYTNTEGKLIGLTEALFKSATWPGYSDLASLEAAVFTEDTVINGAACPHDWQYTARNDGTHVKYCAIEGGCGKSEVLDCEYEVAVSTDHQNHVKTCKYCGYSVTEPCTKIAMDQPATCTDNRKVGFGCSVCGDVEWNDVADTALGHAWVYEHTEGTAEAASTHSKSCSRCDVAAVVEACAFSDVYTPHTCTENGYTTYTCTCGYSYKVEDTSEEGKAQHSFNYENGMITKYPTYILDGMSAEEQEACKGTINYFCEHCDAFDTAAINALTGPGVVYSSEATEIEGGWSIKVTLELVNNPGIAGLTFNFGYNADALTLTGIANGDVVGNDYFVGVKDGDLSAVNGAFKVSLLNEQMKNLTEADTKDKAIVVLTFTSDVNVTIDPSQLWVTTDAADINGATVEVGGLAPKFVSYIWGDANGDGAVNISDALLLLQYLVDLAGEDAVNMKAADADRNGSVGVSDALMILQYLVDMVEWDPNGNTVCPF